MYRFKVKQLVMELLREPNFNTSHVSVQDVRQSTFIRHLSYFNTSHVSVQVDIVCIHTILIKISIHHMYRFKFINVTITGVPNTFQYITCIGSSALILSSSFISELFQYITCIGSSSSTSTIYTLRWDFNTSHVSVQGLTGLKTF